MADISKEINDFRAAVYGRDVRESMISLAEKVNEEVETNTTHVDEAVTTANGASQKATKASEEVQKAITEANTTLQEANAAKVSAQESATASAGSASAAAGSASAASGSAANAAASAKAVEDIAAGLGGFDGTATSVKATDTQGIVVAAGADSNAQALLDALARKVALELVSNTALTTKLADYLKKTDIVQTESTATNKVPSSAYLKQVKDSIDSNLEKLDSNLELLYSSDSLAIATQDIMLPHDFSTYKIIIIYLAINYNGSILHFSDFVIRLPTDTKITSNFTLSSYFNNTGFLSIRCSLFNNLLQIKEISAGTSWSGQKMALYVYGK